MTQRDLFDDDAAENRARLIRGTAQPRARARRADPETSHEAAKSVVELRKRQQAVLEVLKCGPTTDEELVCKYPYFAWEEADYPKQSPSGLRTRRSELVALGTAGSSS